MKKKAIQLFEIIISKMKCCISKILCGNPNFSNILFFKYHLINVQPFFSLIQIKEFNSHQNTNFAPIKLYSRNFPLAFPRRVPSSSPLFMSRLCVGKVRGRAASPVATPLTVNFRGEHSQLHYTHTHT